MTEQPDYKSTVFLPVTDFPMKAGLPQKEPAILAKWQANDLYGQMRAARAERDPFILHDGPPYANGDMHIGHALNHILKDMVCRTQSLLGKDAPYVPGWDCHGLPIEWKVEEAYRKAKKNKDAVPLDEFRAECRAYAQKWVAVQREQNKRLGVLGNWDNPYLTMDFAAEATIVAELLKFAESGLLYRGSKPVMWSPVEKTALAEAEVEYEDITSTQIDVAFEIVSAPNCPAIQDLIDEGKTVSSVIWTTTPWTIPVNQAIAYGPELRYVLVRSYLDMKHQDTRQLERFEPLKTKGKSFLVAKDLLPEFEKRLTQDFHFSPAQEGVFSFEILWAGQGSQLAGATARHPMAHAFLPPSPSGEGPGVGSGEIKPQQDDKPHPNPSPEGEGLKEGSGAEGEGLDPAPNIDRTSPFAAFYARPRPFLPGDFVTTESGTGLVHMAPDHGEDDFDLCKANGIDPVFAVEDDGKYRADWAWPNPTQSAGQGSVINPKFNAPDGPILADLRAAGALLAASSGYSHSYPHSWRSKAKVIYRCTPQWFVPMDVPLNPSTTSLSAGGPPPRSGEVLDGAAAIPPRYGEGDHPQDGGGDKTLRQTAMVAIAATRFVPDKGRNRIGSMVAGRPDWVLSRQRAWGVPITLFVDRKTGHYLTDPAVNARIIAAVREQGVDAWCDDRAQDYLGSDYAAADFERVTDILDVWFDSGCTHAFVLESGRWPELTRRDGAAHPADLYLEGSDQHRGWFQSSLLQSCATRGRAPYAAVLTHGFTMDSAGKKMSKSLGNTVDPIKVMETSGADIIRLWALSVDFTEDHRIGDEILKGVGDQYRKLRNTFRYLLGALAGHRVDDSLGTVPILSAADVAAMPELERYMLHLLAQLDARLARAVDDFDFNTYVRALTDFCNEDLSAFYFDIRKDSLYCDVNPATGVQTDKRRACLAVLDTLFHALVRYAAPVLVFTAEEVWSTRYPDGGSVHLLEWPVLPTLPHLGGGRSPSPDSAKWSAIRAARALASEAIEPLRRDKLIRSSLEAEVVLRIQDPAAAAACRSVDMAEICITAACHIADDADAATVSRTQHHKCGRCWRHLPGVAEDGALCGRCSGVLA